MFYCEECRVSNEWPEGISRSYGKCECCGSNKVVCYDVPSKNLPPIKQTSLEWYVQRENQRVILLDPDGWDRKNFDHSWTKERVTKEEYERRLGLSTCLIAPPKGPVVSLTDTYNEGDRILVDSREYGEQEAQVFKILGDILWWESRKESGVIYPGGPDKIICKTGS